jgi:SAM-dependent methyltransferase
MVGAVSDAAEHPRVVAIYDALDPDRSDLEVYVAVAEELGALRVLDVGCGTGTFALLLADRGLNVTGVDPSSASLAVAQAKPGAERVRWIHGGATALPPLQVDLATMTANVAQAIVDEASWEGTLRGVFDALRPGGHLVFETRDPAREAWREWNRDASYGVTEIEGVGVVESWVEVTEVRLPLGDLSGDLCVRLGRRGVDDRLDLAVSRAGRGSGGARLPRLRRRRRPGRAGPARAGTRLLRAASR